MNMCMYMLHGLPHCDGRHRWAHGRLETARSHPAARHLLPIAFPHPAVPLGPILANAAVGKTPTLRVLSLDNLHHIPRIHEHDARADAGGAPLGGLAVRGRKRGRTTGR